jgi:hypothetical protein
MALLQGTKKLFGPLLDDLDIASRDKKLFGPLLDDLDCVSAVKVAMELQVEACMQ